MPNPWGNSYRSRLPTPTGLRPIGRTNAQLGGGTGVLSWGDPSKPAILLLHGFLGDPQEWEEVAVRLADSYHCLAPSLPGHAGAPPQAADFPGLAAELWDQINTDLPDCFALVGYSLGGRLAMEIARQQVLLAEQPLCTDTPLPNGPRKRIDSLILEGAHPGLDDSLLRSQRRAHDESWAQRFEQGPWPEVLDQWYRQPVFKSLNEQQRAHLISRRARHNPCHLAAVLRGGSLARQPQMHDVLRKLEIPIAYIAGGKDEKFSAIGTELKAVISNLRLAKLPGVGHNCHAEEPEQVVQEIHSLLSNIHPSSVSSSI
nr:2-succinyl-6-hydroxy-2,4-cyclohexadiene-1-carboxylate synthase [Halorhodospira halochloris]